jgi:hypothetical protein
MASRANFVASPCPLPHHLRPRHRTSPLTLRENLRAST